jgi:hypothetical protein
VPFPHRSPRRSSANAACGSLTPPPAGRRRRATTFITCTAPHQRNPLSRLLPCARGAPKITTPPFSGMGLSRSWCN